MKKMGLYYLAFTAVASCSGLWAMDKQEIQQPSTQPSDVILDLTTAQSSSTHRGTIVPHKHEYASRKKTTLNTIEDRFNEVTENLTAEERKAVYQRLVKMVNELHTIDMELGKASSSTQTQQQVPQPDSYTTAVKKKLAYLNPVTWKRGTAKKSLLALNMLLHGAKLTQILSGSNEGVYNGLLGIMYVLNALNLSVVTAQRYFKTENRLENFNSLYNIVSSLGTFINNTAAKAIR